MLNEIETQPIVPVRVYQAPVGKFAERVLFHLQQLCNGECENNDEDKLDLIVGVIFTTYELGVRDGVERSCKRIKRLLTMKGGDLD